MPLDAEEKLKRYRELVEIEDRINEMKEARDRQAAEWRRMINAAMARRTALFRQLKAGSFQPDLPMDMPDEEEDEDAEETQ